MCRTELLADGVAVLDVAFRRDAKDTLSLSSERYDFKMTVGRKWPLDDPEKFDRVSDATAARFQNAGFMADLALATESMLNSLSYLGPLRSHPRRTYQWSGDTPASVGQMGEQSIAAILAAENDGRQLNRGPHKGKSGFAAFIAGWLKDLGVIQDFSVRPVAPGRREYEVLIKTGSKSPGVKITDVGFGVSQVLPALVQAYYCPPTSSVWMEQPEIHLHPQVQAELADVFISATQARQNGASNSSSRAIPNTSSTACSAAWPRGAVARASGGLLLPPLRCRGRTRATASEHVRRHRELARKLLWRRDGRRRGPHSCGKEAQEGTSL